jgi:hypothetical protein
MAILESGKALNSIALEELRGVSEQYLKDQDAKWPHHSGSSSSTGKSQFFGGDKDHPWYSGQTHDSVAVRVAQGNKTAHILYMPTSAYPPPGEPGRYLNPDGSQTMRGFSGGIIGAELGRQVSEHNVSYYFLPGVQVQLVVGVPYANIVNESSRHMGFVDNLSNELFNYVYNWIDGGGLTRNTVIATDKGAKIVKTRNYKYTR